MSVQEIFELIINNTRLVIPELEGHIFKYDDQLVDLGANSVDRAEIVTMTMEDLSLMVPRVELYGVKNIGQLAEVFYEKLQSV